MRTAVLALLALTACAPERDPSIRYIVTTPEQIATTACAFNQPNCRNVIGLAIMTKPCTILVPPYSAKTAHIWAHEERHCREGHFHPEYIQEAGHPVFQP